MITFLMQSDHSAKKYLSVIAQKNQYQYYFFISLYDIFFDPTELENRFEI